MAQDLRDLFEPEGNRGLLALPGVGAGIAAGIGEMLRTGRWNQVERLRGTLDPERLFQSIPGVGASLARRIHESLRVTALFSNAARAHQLGRTHDWVVVYFHADSQPEGQRTVVTETAGELKGKRVVRGLEVECHAHYRQGNGGARTPQSAHRSLTGRPFAGPAC